MPAGRPCEYTQEMAERICTEIASGRTLISFAGKEGFPCRDTIYRWKAEFPVFAELYARARKEGAESFAEQAIDIADDCSKDDGNDSVQRSRLQVDIRKWWAAKADPERYGEFQKQELKVNGKIELGVSELLQAIDGRTRGLPTGS